MKRALLERAGRLGLASRGVLYLLVAFLAVQMAFGRNDQPAEKQGALRGLADTGPGRVVLVALTVGFGAYALWRFGEAVAGHRSEDDDRKRAVKRIASLAKGLLYAIAAATAASTFLGDTSGGDSNEQSRTLTARVLQWPAGRALVIAAGLVAVGVGLYLARKGLATKFEDKQRTDQMAPWMQVTAKVVGLVGLVARGLVACLFGGLLIRSAVHRDPNQAQGVDGTLRTIIGQPYGRPVLLVTAAGLAAFGLHSFVDARYRRTG